MGDFDSVDVDNPHYEMEATFAHSQGVSSECLRGRCGNCWDDDCACPMCGHYRKPAREGHR